MLTASSKKMFKTRINKWQLHKNYKAADKRQLARVVKAYQDQGLDHELNSLTVQGRLVKLDRVWRFLRQQRTTAKVHVHISAALPFAASASAVTVFVFQWPLPKTSETSRVESVLLQTRWYLQARFSARFPSQCGAVWSAKLQQKVCQSLNMLKRQRHARAWQLMHEACEMVAQILGQPYHGRLRMLYMLFCDTLFDEYPELKRHLLRYFANTAVATLGSEHPLSRVIFHMQDVGVLSGSSRPVLELMTEAFKNHFGCATTEGWHLKCGICYLLKRQKDYRSRKSFALKLIAEYEEVKGSADLNSGIIFRRSSHVYRDQALDHDMELVNLDIL